MLSGLVVVLVAICFVYYGAFFSIEQTNKFIYTCCDYNCYQAVCWFFCWYLISSENYKYSFISVSFTGVSTSKQLFQWKALSLFKYLTGICWVLTIWLEKRKLILKIAFTASTGHCVASLKNMQCRRKCLAFCELTFLDQNDPFFYQASIIGLLLKPAILCA